MNATISRRCAPRSSRCCGEAASAPLQGSDRLHFHQEALLHKSIDDQQCVGRVDSIGEIARKVPLAEVHEFRNVLRMNQIGRKLDNALPPAADGRERSFDVAKHLPALRVKIILANNGAGNVGCQLTRDEENSEALTRVICEYWPSGFPNSLGLTISI